MTYFSGSPCRLPASALRLCATGALALLVCQSTQATQLNITISRPLILSPQAVPLNTLWMVLRVEDSNQDGFIEWNYGVGELLGLDMLVFEVGYSATPFFASQERQTIKDLRFDLNQNRFNAILAIGTGMVMYSQGDPEAPFIQLGGSYGPIYQVSLGSPQVSVANAPVPEPSTMLMFACAGAALLWRRRQQS